LASSLGDLSEVSRKLIFFNDEKVLGAHFSQPEVSESLHKHADPRPGRFDHLGQLLILEFDANAARVFLAESARQL